MENHENMPTNLSWNIDEDKRRTTCIEAYRDASARGPGGLFSVVAYALMGIVCFMEIRSFLSKSPESEPEIIGQLLSGHYYLLGFHSFSEFQTRFFLDSTQII